MRDILLGGGDDNNSHDSHDFAAMRQHREAQSYSIAHLSMKEQIARIPNPCLVLRIDSGYDAIYWHAKGIFRAVKQKSKNAAFKAVYALAGEVEP